MLAGVMLEKKSGSGAETDVFIYPKSHTDLPIEDREGKEYRRSLRIRCLRDIMCVSGKGT